MTSFDLFIPSLNEKKFFAPLFQSHKDYVFQEIKTIYKKYCVRASNYIKFC